MGSSYIPFFSRNFWGFFTCFFVWVLYLADITPQMCIDWTSESSSGFSWVFQGQQVMSHSHCAPCLPECLSFIMGRLLTLSWRHPKHHLAPLFLSAELQAVSWLCLVILKSSAASPELPTL